MGLQKFRYSLKRVLPTRQLKLNHSDATKAYEDRLL